MRLSHYFLIKIDKYKNLYKERVAPNSKMTKISLTLEHKMFETILISHLKRIEIYE